MIKRWLNLYLINATKKLERVIWLIIDLINLIHDIKLHEICPV